MKGFVVLLIVGFLFASISILYPCIRSKDVVGNTLYVGGSGPGNYTGIQGAIDNASEGDSIFVFSGIYEEHITINKSIKIMGENKEYTIINGNNTFRDYSIVIVSAKEVAFENFTIINSSSRFVVIEMDEIIFITTAGIQILSDNCILSNNKIINNDAYGIWIQNSYNNTINDNIISNNTGGTDYAGGIYLENSTNNVIFGNSIYYGNNGIVLAADEQGSYSDNNTIYDNNISDCKFGAGISLHSNSSNNTIKENTIINCLYRGINIESENNTIYHNNFINNSYNAKDVSENNWYDPEINQGNYWDDYNGTDKNNNGIGDIPYNIPGGNSQDRFPLMMPYDGALRLKEFYVNNELVNTMLVIGMIIVIIFLSPIAYIWYKKTKK